jgi:hypothetical protein
VQAYFSSSKSGMRFLFSSFSSAQSVGVTWPLRRSTNPWWRRGFWLLGSCVDAGRAQGETQRGTAKGRGGRAREPKRTGWHGAEVIAVLAMRRSANVHAVVVCVVVVWRADSRRACGGGRRGCCGSRVRPGRPNGAGSSVERWRAVASEMVAVAGCRVRRVFAAACVWPCRVVGGGRRQQPGVHFAVVFHPDRCKHRKGTRTRPKPEQRGLRGRVKRGCHGYGC